MTGEKMREVLIAPVMGHRDEGGWSILRALAMTSLLLLVTLSAVRYESKINRLEARLEILETESILKEALGLQVKVSDLMGGEVKFMDNPVSEESPRREKREANPLRPSQQIVRNEQDETYFTRGRQGYVRPSGTREMFERLPPTSDEVGYQSPPIDYSQQAAVQTRAAPTSGQTYIPPVQRVGHGPDQVSARVIRYNRRDNDNMDTKQTTTSTVAGHFVADVSNFTSSDNPRLRNSNGIFQIWKPASWMNSGNFLLDSKDGVVTVQKGGIFHIYAQIHYHDEQQQNSFVVDVNDSPLLQCTTTQNGSNSCFTAGLTELKRGDRIVIKNLGVDRFSIYKPEKSFFGLVKVGH